MRMCLFCAGVKIERLEAEEDTPKRNTVSVRLSMFAAHNAFHHCEQCHHYSEPAPATQVRTFVDPSCYDTTQKYTYTDVSRFIKSAWFLLVCQTS